MTIRSQLCQEAQISGFGSARADLGHRNGQRHILDVFVDAECSSLAAGEITLRTSSLVPPPAGQDAHTHFGQAHVGLSGSDDAVGGHGHFGAAAQRHAEGRRHHRLAATGEHLAHIPAAKILSFIQRIPIALLGIDGDKEDIGSSRKMFALIADHQTRELPFHCGRWPHSRC